jgi:hypothetical protein
MKADDIELLAEIPEDPHQISHAPHADQWFTSAGGYVLLQKEANGHPLRVAVTRGEDDEGVQLEDHEGLVIADFLLHQFLTPAEYELVRAGITAGLVRIERGT